MYCEACKKALSDNSIFCPYCGTVSRQESAAQQTAEVQESSIQQMPPAQPQVASWQYPQEKNKIHAGLIVFAVAIVLSLIAACTFAVVFLFEATHDEVRTSLDSGGRALDWGSAEDRERFNELRAYFERETHPREDEILQHLSEKYGEEFRIVSYNADFSSGVITLFPFRDRSISCFFELQYADEEGRDLSVGEMRDDYQLLLAGDLAEDKIWPLLKEHLDSREIEQFHVSYSINLDYVSRTSWSPVDYLLPADFMWDPSDGLDAFVDSFDYLDMDVSLALRVSVRSQDALDAVSNDDIEALIEEITRLGFVGSCGFIRITSLDIFSLASFADDYRIRYDWEVRNNEVVNGRFLP